MSTNSSKVKRLIWPFGVAAAGIGTAAVVMLRGCWHNNMSWPLRHGSYSYRTCTKCGIMRLFDEQHFRGYGPYGYDLDELILKAQAAQQRRMAKIEPPTKAAS